jgi:hypothetical protein
MADRLAGETACIEAALSQKQPPGCGQVSEK